MKDRKVAKLKSGKEYFLNPNPKTAEPSDEPKKKSKKKGK